MHILYSYLYSKICVQCDTESTPSSYHPIISSCVFLYVYIIVLISRFCLHHVYVYRSLSIRLRLSHCKTISMHVYLTKYVLQEYIYSSILKYVYSAIQNTPRTHSWQLNKQ